MLGDWRIYGLVEKLIKFKMYHLCIIHIQYICILRFDISNKFPSQMYLLIAKKKKTTTVLVITIPNVTIHLALPANLN